MGNHVRGALWLFGLTVVLCCVLYPLSLWLIGQAAFRAQAEGSLVRDEDGKVVGSLLIAQQFSGDEYFWPRPSHAGSKGYEANASGGSNWGANNPQLRERVARALGPLVKYRSGPKKGQRVASDITAWARENRADQLAEVKAEDIAGKFFDPWRQAHPDADLEEVPADLVMASGSGLDPHITLANALYQAPRVAAARAKLLAKKRGVAADDARVQVFTEQIHKELVKLLNERAGSPLFGLAGVPLVNVLEVNVALPGRVDELAKATR